MTEEDARKTLLLGISTLCCHHCGEHEKFFVDFLRQFPDYVDLATVIWNDRRPNKQVTSEYWLKQR